MMIYWCKLNVIFEVKLYKNLLTMSLTNSNLQSMDKVVYRKEKFTKMVLKFEKVSEEIVRKQ